MPNIELLKRTLRYIEDHPYSWDQATFYTYDECGTSHCFAGWAVVLSGVRPHPDEKVLVDELPPEVRDRLDPKDVWVEFPGTRITTIADAATALLDVGRWRALPDHPHLFDGGNTLDDLRAMVAELCADAAPGGA
jgi:hypothetical protein